MAMNQEAVELLYANLGSIPHEEYGSICLMPFAVDSDQTNALKRQVCEGICNVLSDAGLLVGRAAAPAEPARDVTLTCRLCSEPLLNLRVDASGIANVPAAAVLSTMARMDPECPHKVLTSDDQRRKIEDAVRASQS